MNYQLKNSSRSNRYKRPLQITAVIVVLFLLLRLIFPNVLFSILSTVYTPIWKLGDVMGVNDYFTTRGILLSENIDLRDRLNAMSGNVASITLLEQENTELKQFLGRRVPKSIPEDFVLGAVLKVPPVSAYDDIIIDVGTNDNIEIGDTVFAAGSDDSGVSAASSSMRSMSTTSPTLVPIGVISQVSGGTSVVQLYSHPGQKYPVIIGPTHIQATAVAKGGGTFQADLAQGANVHVGDIVSVPSIEPLIFGTIGSIIDNPAQPYSSVLFNEPVNIFQLRWVEVQRN